MTVEELARRVEALEKQVEELKTQVAKNGQTEPPNKAPWWTPEGGAGRFKDDPGFEEMVRLGREYRESLRPGAKKKKKKAKKAEGKKK